MHFFEIPSWLNDEADQTTLIVTLDQKGHGLRPTDRKSREFLTLTLHKI